ncbi:hypothetical protein HK104_002004 [Borealophlyctis nickersoniae]|nr:hypothetical protein HK104_002004 [Borealophlyctis nickersoniae]
MQVEIVGPWPILRSGATLVDLPGFGDTNPARVKVTKQFLKDYPEGGFGVGCYANNKISTSSTKSDTISVKSAIKSFDLEAEVDGLQISKKEAKNKEKDLKRKIAQQKKLEPLTIKKFQRGNKNTTIHKQMKKLLAEQRDLQEQCRSYDSQIKRKCILARNEFVKANMPNAFPEMTQNGEFRTFCVSAARYDELREKAYARPVLSLVLPNLIDDIDDEHDDDAEILDGVEETEIPALRDYLETVTETQQRVSVGLHMKLLLSLLKVVKSFVGELVVKGEGVGELVVNREGVEENAEERVKAEVEDMRKNLTALVKNVFEDLPNRVLKQVQAGLCPGSESAESRALGISAKWKALRWNRYQAVARRDGSYGDKDFNFDLVEPVLDAVAASWEVAFTRDVNEALRKLKKDFLESSIFNLLSSQAVVAKAQKAISVSLARTAKWFYQRLTGGLTKYFQQVSKDRATSMGADAMMNITQDMECFADRIEQDVQEGQREASRGIVDEVQRIMKPVYEACVGEGGPGMYFRMRMEMKEHIDAHKGHMFKEATSGAVRDLHRTFRNAHVMFEEKALDLEQELHAAYSAFWGDLQKELHRPARLRFLNDLLPIIDNLESLMRAFGIEPGEAEVQEDVSECDGEEINCEVLEVDSDDSDDEVDGEPAEEDEPEAGSEDDHACGTGRIVPGCVDVQ